MDPSLYMAAMEGNIDILMESKDQFDFQVTATKNTVLHVSAQFHDSTEYIQTILKVQPTLLCRVNSRGETALHIAARKGHTKAVEALIECSKTFIDDQEDPESTQFRITKEMLRMTTEEEKDTALHEAVRNNNLQVVKLLVELEEEEDPEFAHAANGSGETPLYIAAERDYHEILSHLLGTFESPAHGGPNGRTALHAAVFSDCPECVAELLDWKPNLAKEADIYGWTPLHCAARRNLVQCATLLLTADRTTAYIVANKDDNNTALHLAARKGHVEAMKEFLFHCPDSWEIVNGRGQNILHIAIENERNGVINFILNCLWLDNLLNQKDIDGNTPIHMLAASDFNIPSLLRHPLADQRSFNKKDLTPRDIAISIERYRDNEDAIIKELIEVGAPWGWRNIAHNDNDRIDNWKKGIAEDKKELKDNTVKLNDTFMLVAALLATVTFAAGFTLPGGYDGNVGPNQGMAILVKKHAFKAFVVSNTLAVIFSYSALFLFLIGSFYTKQCKSKVNSRYSYGFIFLLLAIGAAMVAFITGTYVVLSNSQGLAISVCVIGCSSFLIYYIVFHKLICDKLFQKLHTWFRT